MANILTKNTKTPQRYQQWIVGTDATQGDILNISGSLFNRNPNTVMIQSPGGSSTTIRINVAEEIFREGGMQSDQTWAGLGQGLPRPLPLLVAEVERVQPNLVIDAGATLILSIHDIGVKDIKLITAATGTKITVF